MKAEQAKIVDGGRIVIPARFRKALGLERGDCVWLELQGEHLIVRPARNALRRLQRSLADFSTEKRSVADELIADRRIGETRE